MKFRIIYARKRNNILRHSKFHEKFFDLHQRVLFGIGFKKLLWFEDELNKIICITLKQLSVSAKLQE